MNTELFLATLDSEQGAAKLLASVREREQAGTLRLLNAAVLVKDASGKVHASEREDVDAPHGALAGALVGGLLGLLGGPVGVILGAAAGAATGGATAALVDLGFSSDDLQEVQEQMSTGSSVLVVLLEAVWAESFAQAIAGSGARVIRKKIA